jgi:tetratricopeptide (TPR) repeat protein
MAPLRTHLHCSDWSILAILAVAVVMIYLPVRGHEFLEPEDIFRVVGNPHLDHGIGLGSALAEFAHRHSDQWTPLAEISLHLDATIFGRNSAAPFLTVNLLIHLLNAGLLLAFLRRLETSTPTTAFVVLFFALHPIQVETVARIGGRGELLGASFWMTALFLYTARATAPLRPRREVGVLLCMVAGLAATPGILLLPAILLLLDFWPLGRTDWHNAIMEKLPMIVVLILGAVFLASPTSPGTAREPGSGGPLFVNAVTGLLLSVRDLVWPTDLSPFHVPPTRISIVGTLAGLGALVSVSILCARRSTQLLQGWIWFLLLLLPALSFGGHGLFFRADHWLYLAMIGIAWAAAGIPVQSSRVGFGIGFAVLLVLAVSARAQVGVWQDSESVYMRVIEVEPTNWYGNARLADLAREAGEFRTAEDHYLTALIRVPGYFWAQTGLADAIRDDGDSESARSLYESVLRTRPEDEDAGSRLGFVLLQIHRESAALPLLESALTRDPHSGDLHAALALTHARLSNTDRARHHRDQALHAWPTTVAGQSSLAWLLATAPEPSLRDPELAMRIIVAKPDTERSRATLLDIEAATLAAEGSFAEAFRTAQKATTLASNDEWPRFSAEIRDRARVYLQGNVWTDARGSAPAPRAEVHEQRQGKNDR